MNTSAAISLAVGLLSLIKATVKLGQDIEDKLDEIAALIVARAGAAPSKEELEAAIAASAAAHVTLQDPGE